MDGRLFLCANANIEPKLRNTTSTVPTNETRTLPAEYYLISRL